MKKVFSALLLGLAFVACQPAEYDDTAIKEQIGSLDDRLSKVEEDLATLELNVDAMKTLADALKNGKYIESYEALEDGSGYTIRFSDGTTIVVKHGAKGDKGDTGETGATGATGAAGADGKDGVTPTVTVKEVDGEYYWFINGEQICPVYEETPEFTSKDGVLYVTYPGETEPVAIGALTGVSIFHSVEVKDDVVVFTFVDENGLPGESFTLPLAAEFALEINTSVGLAKDQTEVEIPYTVTGATDATVVDVIAVGCTAAVDAEASVVKVSGITEGAQILVFADNGEGKTSIRKVTFSAEAYSVEPVDEIIPAEGGQVIVKGISNVAFDVVIPAEATWLTQVVSKSSFELTFAAEANTATEARSAEVSFVRQGTEEVLMTVTIAQAANKVLDLTRVWGKYAETAEGWIIMGAGNLDRGMTMDDKYIYVSKSTAYAPVIKAFDYDGNEVLDVNVTGMGAGNQWGDAMTYTVNCVRTIPKADGGYVLLACNLKQDASHVLQVWAWPDGVEAAPTCIARYAYDNFANASDHRRFGDRFNVTGTWEDGLIWFPSMQNDTAGKTIVFSVKSGVVTGYADKNMGPLYFYSMESTSSTMKDIFFYGGSVEEAYMTGNGIAKFVKKDGSAHPAGWPIWAVTDDYSSTLGLTFGYNQFQMNGKNYVAYVKVESVNGKKGSLVVIEDGDGTLEGFKTALTNNKVAWEFPIQHESDAAAESLCATGNSLGNCNVVVVDGVTYIGAHIQGIGCSLFRFE